MFFSLRYKVECFAVLPLDHQLWTSHFTLIDNSHQHVKLCEQDKNICHHAYYNLYFKMGAAWLG